MTQHVDTPYGCFDCFDGDLITRQLIELGAHQRSDLDMLLSFVRPGDCVLDIGAHIGTYSVPLGKALGGNGHVFAFEPVAEHFELLERNVTRNDLLGIVQPVRAAVGLGAFPLRPQYVGGNTGATSLVPMGKNDAANVPVVSLDDWWKDGVARPSSIEVIKIDVEGMEEEVLSSGADVIDECRPVIFFETRALSRTSLTAMDAFFAARGYQFIVNLAGRDRPTESFKLGRLRTLARLERTKLLWNVVAVESSSERRPAVASAFATEFLLLGLATRQRVAEWRRSHFGSRAS